MFIQLFYTLRTYGVPVSTRELLDLHSALDLMGGEGGLVFADRDDFYQLIRLCMVKDEKYFDKFDRAMADYFEGVDSLDIDELMAKLGNIPKEWLELKLDPKNLTEEQRRLLKKYGSLEALMKALEERLKEQKERHQAAVNGSARAEHRHLGRMATTPRVYGWAVKVANAVLSKSGSNANIGIWTAITNSKLAVCKWHYANYANLPAQVHS